MEPGSVSDNLKENGAILHTSSAESKTPSSNKIEFNHTFRTLPIQAVEPVRLDFRTKTI